MSHGNPIPSRIVVAVTVGVCTAMLSLRPGPARAEFAPRVAVIMCQDSYAQGWYEAHSSSQALVGLAGLVGVPYRTLTLAELLAEAEPDYTSIWISSCPVVAEERIGPLAGLLQSHVDGGGSIFLDGPLAAHELAPDGTVTYRGMAANFAFLGVVDGGWYPLAEYAVHSTTSSHPIAEQSGYPAGTRLTQGIPFGIATFALVDDSAPGSDVLLELLGPDGMDAHPYLVVADAGTSGRVLAAGTYGTYVGPASPFRNDAPAGFHDNQLLPYLIDSMLWLVGPDDEPFVGLQLSHAPMTAIGRLDGDWSDSGTATSITLDYLIDMGRRTGVATVYGIVSSFAEGSGWDGFRPGAQSLQMLGGSIGSHSRTHGDNMSDQLDPVGWDIEVAQSLDDIRSALSDADFTPDAYAFINPGNAIQNRDYGEFFADIELFMTHGFETGVPYASGVMGFDLPGGVAAKPVINNTQTPDFQWLYLPGWLYTVEEAAETQARLLDYYQHTVGRGVLYNQMWHDYALSNLLPPENFPESATTQPLYHANIAHFEEERIYAPSVAELIAKMHIAQKVVLSSVMDGDALIATLDYSAVPARYLDHVAGMGVRVNRAGQVISEVWADGARHYAFTDDTVILPATGPGGHTLEIRFAAEPAPSARLTYVSKAFDEVTLQDDTLSVWLGDPGLATKFCFAAPRATVILHADDYQLRPDGEFCGRLDHGSEAAAVVAQALDVTPHEIYITGASRSIQAAAYSDHVVSLEVAAGEQATIGFESTVVPEVLVADSPVDVELRDGEFTIAVPATTGPVPIEILVPEPPCVDTDGSPCSGEPTGCGCTSGAPGGDHPPASLLLLVGALLWRRRRGRCG